MVHTLIESFVWTRTDWLEVRKYIKEVLKFHRNELRYILIPGKCPRKILFQHTVLWLLEIFSSCHFPSSKGEVTKATFPSSQCNTNQFNCVQAVPKVIYPKYSKHWLSTVAHTIDCVCGKNMKSGFKSWVIIFTFHVFWVKSFWIYLKIWD